MACTVAWQRRQQDVSRRILVSYCLKHEPKTVLEEMSRAIGRPYRLAWLQRDLEHIRRDAIERIETAGRLRGAVQLLQLKVARLVKLKSAPKARRRRGKQRIKSINNKEAT